MAVVGRIARTHGLRGQVVVNPETDFPAERFHAGAHLFVERGGTVEQLTVATVRFHGDRPVIGVAGVETIEGAETLVGCELRVPVAELTPLPAGTFYRHDLIGCGVETVGGLQVGIVRDVEGSTVGSRLVVQAGGGEVLIPMAAEICRTVDVAGKRIVIDPPDGLLELNNTSASKASA